MAEVGDISIFKLSFRTEDGDTMFLWTVATNVRVHTASKPIRITSSRKSVVETASLNNQRYQFTIMLFFIQ
jgi:hypothetical protein